MRKLLEIQSDMESWNRKVKWDQCQNIAIELFEIAQWQARRINQLENLITEGIDLVEKSSKVAT